MAVYAFLPSSYRSTSEGTLFAMSLGRLTSVRGAVPSPRAVRSMLGVR
jgi:hypothetical protein